MNRKEGTKHRKRKSNKLKILFWAILFAFVSVLILYLFSLGGENGIISQFVDTVIPRSETCYEWYMDFDLIEKPNEKKKMVWSFKIDYNEAKTYRKEREGMLRPNQWEDLIVRVYI